MVRVAAWWTAARRSATGRPIIAGSRGSAAFSVVAVPSRGIGLKGLCFAAGDGGTVGVVSARRAHNGWRKRSGSERGDIDVRDVGNTLLDGLNMSWNGGERATRRSDGGSVDVDGT